MEIYIIIKMGTELSGESGVLSNFLASFLLDLVVVQSREWSNSGSRLVIIPNKPDTRLGFLNILILSKDDSARTALRELRSVHTRSFESDRIKEAIYVRRVEKLVRTLSNIPHCLVKSRLLSSVLH